MTIFDTVIEVRGCNPSLLRVLKRKYKEDLVFIEEKNCWLIKNIHNKNIEIPEVPQMTIFETSNKDKAEAAAEVLRFLFPEADIELDLENGFVFSEGIKFSYKNGSLRMMIYCPVCLQEVHSRPIRRPADIAPEDQMRADKHDCIDVNA